MANSQKFTTAFSTYETERIIGEGGSGRVFKAIDSAGDQFAIKVLSKANASGNRLKRFKNEYLFCSRNVHPNILTVTDYGLSEDGSPFFAMSLYEGSLRNFMSGLGSASDRYDVFLKVLAGAEAAHLQGVRHRDLKPENILVRGNELVVADFGIAEFLDEVLYTAVETKDGERLANFQYAAPEQRQRGTLVDHRSDIYALGLMLNELFTATVPHGTNFKTIASVSAEFAGLDAIVSQMIAQAPASRPDSLGDVRRLLNMAAAQQSARQKLSVVNNRVISDDEVDDPLASIPPKLIGVDWDQGQLTLTLDVPASQGWLNAFYDMGGHTALLGHGPETFIFSGARVTAPARSAQAQQIIDHFKTWLGTATRVYKQKAEAEIRRRKEREAAVLEAARRLAEERVKTVSNLRI